MRVLFPPLAKDGGRYFIDLGKSTDIIVAGIIDPGKNYSFLFSAINIPPFIYVFRFSKSQFLTSPSEISRCPRESPTAFQGDSDLRAISRPRLIDPRKYILGFVACMVYVGRHFWKRFRSWNSNHTSVKCSLELSRMKVSININEIQVFCFF